MHDSSVGSVDTSSEQPSTGVPGSERHTSWNRRLVGQVAILILVNAMVDTVVTAPLLVLPEMLDHFGTDQSAWIDASSLLAGAMWAPLLGKSADIHGKRRVLVMTLLTALAGALVCLVAPSLWVLILGRLLQGAAVGAVFLTVALIRDICAPDMAMIATGIVTSGSALLSIGMPVLFEITAAEFGWRSVFVASAVFAAIATVLVHRLLPASTLRTPGKVDIAGALLLGGGLAAALSYISLGSDFGWFAVGPLALLVAGAAALARWFLVASRVPEPVIDIRNLGRPLVLTLLVVVFGTGAYQSMLTLFGLIAKVSADQHLGYGLAAPGALGLLYGVPAIGIVLGGTLAGALGTRFGPAVTLAGGVALGTVGTVGMFLGDSVLPLAVVCSFLLSLTAGTLVTSGFNLAATLAPPERQGVVSSMVMVMVATGAVILKFVGSAVLKSTDMVVDGETVNSAAGVHGYIAMATGAFVAAGVVAVILLRTRRSAAEDKIHTITAMNES
ncbi:MFS transporter [Streptomyces sp. NBS 14/10]|uniref:MFS transporter n=1 Tax=Streptomyces sp. NBS 14/10 TaxID=1945643 RepID=UPI00211B4FFD|nr:MFS transporter [Streptomyces sp. NBS 14/10]KAK1185666.1 MFS transporter [Streptomyces sp. NBS 14/10]